MKTDSPKSSTLLSLIAVIVSAGTFKDELKTVALWEGSWNLLEVFIGFALFYSFIFAMYLLVESSEDVPGFRYLTAAKKFTYILDFLFLSSILLIVAFSLLAVALNLLVIPAVLETTVKATILLPTILFVWYQFIGLRRELKELEATKVKLNEIKRRIHEEDKSINSR